MREREGWDRERSSSLDSYSGHNNVTVLCVAAMPTTLSAHKRFLFKKTKQNNVHVLGSAIHLDDILSGI